MRRKRFIIKKTYSIQGHNYENMFINLVSIWLQHDSNENRVING